MLVAGNLVPRKKRLRASPTSGEIPRKEDPPPLNMPRIRPIKMVTPKDVLLREKDFGEDWMAVSNDAHGPQNTPTSGHPGCSFFLERGAMDPSRGLSGPMR